MNSINIFLAVKIVSQDNQAIFIGLYDENLEVTVKVFNQTIEIIQRSINDDHGCGGYRFKCCLGALVNHPANR